jgi:7 transmembrane sweet-taste receptor of 3 GCPR/Receptor family ligand binding region
MSHLTSNSEDGSNQRNVPIDFEVYIEVSAWMAWYHYTTASNGTTILPEVHDRLLASCQQVDFQFLMRDTKFSALGAARELLISYNDFQKADSWNHTNVTNAATNGTQFWDEWQEINDPAQVSQQTALIGTVRSVENSAMSFLASAFGIPQIASSSTAAYLDNKDVYPLFSRTVPTNMGDAQAMVLYLKSLQVSHVGILYIGDDYGNDFHGDLVKELISSEIVVVSVQYDDNAQSAAIQQLVSSDLRYFIAILNPGTWQPLIRLAFQNSIIGRPDYFWLFSESSLGFVDPTFELDRETESDLAFAIHGSAVLSAMYPAYDLFDQALLQFSKSEEEQQLYINQHAELDLLDNFTFSHPGPSLYQYLTYDAVLAMMLATCEAQGTNDTDWGRQIYNQLLQTEFQGVSGFVSFDAATGTRRSQNIRYSVRNVLLAENVSKPDLYRFTSETSSIINLDGVPRFIENQNLFVYFNNSTIPPQVLPPVNFDMNLISAGIRVFGLALGAFVMLVSVWWMSWTLLHREKDIVKASQPIFLCQLCIGTFMIASGVIPMSLQEPISSHGLDIACLSTPWLISVGFVTAISALFTKTWRLNLLMKHSRNLRRIALRPRDVAGPFIILMTINIVIMLAWSIDAPYVWERQSVANYDKFGRSVETVGLCQLSDKKHAVVYPSLIVALNISVLVFANYQAYLARNLPSKFSESTYIAIAMIILLEVSLLSIPILFLASEDPSVVFLIRSILASVSGLSILLPVFLPKFIQRTANMRYQAAHLHTYGTRPHHTAVQVTISGATVNAASVPGVLSIVSDVVHTHDGPIAATNNSEKSDTGVLTIRRNQDYYKERLTNESRSGEFHTRSPNASNVPSVSLVESCAP